MDIRLFSYTQYVTLFWVSLTALGFQVHNCFSLLRFEKYPKGCRPANAVFYHLSAWIATLLAAVLYSAVVLVSGNLYSAYDSTYILWNGTIFYTSLTIMSCSAFFLMVERCAIVMFPLYKTTIGGAIQNVAIATMIGGFFLLVGLTAFSEGRVEGLVDTPIFFTVAHRHHAVLLVFVRQAICLFGLLPSLACLFIMHYNFSSTVRRNPQDCVNARRVAYVSTFTEFFCSTMPAVVCSYFESNMADESRSALSAYVNAYILLMFCADAVFMAFIHRRIVHKVAEMSSHYARRTSTSKTQPASAWSSAVA